jgi:hypothetical protein
MFAIPEAAASMYEAEIMEAVPEYGAATIFRSDTMMRLSLIFIQTTLVRQQRHCLLFLT